MCCKSSSVKRQASGVRPSTLRCPPHRREVADPPADDRQALGAEQRRLLGFLATVAAKRAARRHHPVGRKPARPARGHQRANGSGGPRSASRDGDVAVGRHPPYRDGPHRVVDPVGERPGHGRLGQPAATIAQPAATSRSRPLPSRSRPPPSRSGPPPSRSVAPGLREPAACRRCPCANVPLRSGVCRALQGASDRRPYPRS